MDRSGSMGWIKVQEKETPDKENGEGAGNVLPEIVGPANRK